MAIHNLTTIPINSGGSIRQPSCISTETGSVNTTGISYNDTCVGMYSDGTEITVTATPDSGYSIESWSAPGITPINITSTEFIFIMPDEDATVSVSFIKDPVVITYGVGGGLGCISYHGDERCQNDSFGSDSTNQTVIRVNARPEESYRVDKWTVDGIDSDSSGTVFDGEYLDIILGDVSSVDVVVFFVLESFEECNKNRLTVNIEGSGSVSVESGLYCEFEEKILNPVSSNGYFFKEWVYNDPTITEEGISLVFDMSKNRVVTAVFEKIFGYLEEDYSLFYCPSAISRTNTIDFTFTNADLNPNPSSFDDFHFRATFYSDPEKTKVLYSAFSLSDNKRWFYNDGSFKQIPREGVNIPDGESLDITYSPEVLPAGLSETQREEFISSNAVEFKLICGNRYYIDIDAYSQAFDDLQFVKSVTLIVNCEDVDAFYSYEDKDRNNWICSGQGNSDLLVTGDNGQSLFPAIGSNHFGIFNIVWQSRRGNTNTVYGALWDSNNDLLYSSGQGMYDTKIFNDGFRPEVITDPSSTFYISSYSRSQLNYYYCPIPTTDANAPDETQEEEFERLCYPGQSTKLSSTMDNIIVRVYEEDTDDNLVIRKDKVIPIVTKTNIRLDIDGTSALYAVRLRDSSDAEWSSWINVDTMLYGGEEGLDITSDAYKISDSRIIVPWAMDRVNGVRRICCQLLTLYGISPTICIDVFMNVDIIHYIFKFYNDSNMSEDSEVPVYKGMPVVSLVRDPNTGEIIGNDNGDTTIYFRVLFSEDIITTVGGIDYYNGEKYNPGDFTFNMVQQGIDDVWGGILGKEDNRTLKGNFKIHEHDGVFNKDGRAFIQVILSNSLGNTICLSDKSDPYNLMLNSVDAGRYHDLVPEEVFNQYKTSQIEKALETIDFKQYYKVDDDNFRFGNPDFFRNDRQRG